MVSTTGENPSTCTNLECGLRNPEGAGHGQVGHGLRLDALHLLRNQAEAVAEVNDGGLDATAYLRCEDEAVCCLRIPMPRK